jgi:hypothetical protein
VCKIADRILSTCKTAEGQSRAMLKHTKRIYSLVCSNTTWSDTEAGKKIDYQTRI